MALPVLTIKPNSLMADNKFSSHAFYFIIIPLKTAYSLLASPIRISIDAQKNLILETPLIRMVNDSKSV